MNEQIATLTPGQHIIFGMVLSHISNELNLVFPTSNYGRLAQFIKEFDAPDSMSTDLTPSESIQEYLEDSYKIFVEIWEQYQEVFLALQKD